VTVGEPVLRLRDLRKQFVGTPVLRGVSLDVAPGEVHALIGQNGSGKSTLIKILAGFHLADAGSEAWIDGEPLDLSRPVSETSRLRFVHQDLGQILELDAVDNMGLSQGFARKADRLIDWRGQRRRTKEALAPFGVEIDVTLPLGQATPLQRSVVAIATALEDWSGGHGVLVLDEPTAALPPHEVATLFEIVRGVRSRGASVIYVSHRMDEIFELADTVSVLRGGAIVATRAIAETTPDELATLMVGTSVERVSPPRRRIDEQAALALEVRNLRSKYLRGVDLVLRRGEVVGLAGLQGSGRDDFPYVVAGMSEQQAGQLRLDGEGPWAPVGKRGLQLPIVPADRLREALVADFDSGENLTISNLSALRRGPLLEHRREGALVRDWIDRLSVVPDDPRAAVLTLSGGNQQKLVIGRVLAEEPRLVVLCDPTAGVDIATRQAIYRLIEREVAGGLSVIVSSADVEDLVSLCTRVLVLRDGVVERELRGAEITEGTITHAMEGVGA
jgi:ribose transport system ATP-binding protein